MRRNSNHKIFRLGELFCGPGGMALGAMTTGVVTDKEGKAFSIQHIWGVDRDADAIATFGANLGSEGTEALQMDAMQFTREGLTKKRAINALAFGFPCNSFSSVGKRRGIKDTTYGELYKAGITVIERYNPDWFIAENVSGIAHNHPGNDFSRILRELSKAGLGYRVVAHLYKFEEYGVPQCRHRFIIVGIRSDITRTGIQFKVPAPTHGPRGKISKFVSAQDALSALSYPAPQGWGSDTIKQSETVTWRLLLTAPGKNVWDLETIKNAPDDLTVLDYIKNLPWYNRSISCMGDRICLQSFFNNDVALMREKLTEVCLEKVKSARMSHIYRRLEADRPAYTITGSGGGGTRLYHWEEPRALTNRERAALQTFPPEFVFHGSRESIRRQIGMAVPIVGARILFESILKTFAGIAYDCLPDDDAGTVIEVGD